MARRNALSLHAFPPFPSKTPVPSPRGWLLRVLVSLAALGSVAALPALAGPQPGTLEVRVRDSATGVGLQAHVTVSPAQAGGQTWWVDASRPLLAEVSSGSVSLSVQAAGHRLLSTQLSVAPGQKLPVTLWLDPAQVPDVLKVERLRGLISPGQTLIHGHVVDAESLKPLAGVRVKPGRGKQSAVSDARGYFALRLPAPAISDADHLPEVEEVTLSLAGYRSWEVGGLFLAGGTDTHLLVELSRGKGLQGRDDTHQLLQDLREHGPHAKTSVAPGQGSLPQCPAVSLPQASPPRVPGVSVPSSIRVGTSCSCSTCSAVSVYSLEQYVKNSLNDEWIASWPDASLRSGAVPVRSYGAYYVSHPISSSYDICNTTCCQVMDTDTSSTTNAATDATAGVVLTQDGTTIFRSEYSAENNQCYCSDGQAGQPSASWPCLSDSVCAGTSCNGHGRGMCQWGTDRWALQGKDWEWIANHYYNSNGNPSGLRSAYLSTGGGSSNTCTGSPSDANCNEQDPEATGCAATATTLATVTLERPGRLLGYVDLRYSSACQSSWSRVRSAIGETSLMATIRSDDGSSYNATGTSDLLWSPLLFSGSRAVQACGRVSGMTRCTELQ